MGKKGEKEKRGVERGIDAVLAGSETHVEGEHVEEASGGKATQGLLVGRFGVEKTRGSGGEVDARTEGLLHEEKTATE